MNIITPKDKTNFHLLSATVGGLIAFNSPEYATKFNLPLTQTIEDAVALESKNTP